MSTTRQERLREILSPANETAAILRILNRRRAARAHGIAQERRQAHRAKEAAWIDIERAKQSGALAAPKSQPSQTRRIGLADLKRAAVPRKGAQP